MNVCMGIYLFNNKASMLCWHFGNPVVSWLCFELASSYVFLPSEKIYTLYAGKPAAEVSRKKCVRWRKQFFLHASTIPHVMLSSWFGCSLYISNPILKKKRKTLITLKNQQRNVQTLSLNLWSIWKIIREMFRHYHWTFDQSEKSSDKCSDIITEPLINLKNHLRNVQALSLKIRNSRKHQVKQWFVPSSSTRWLSISPYISPWPCREHSHWGQPPL